MVFHSSPTMRVLIATACVAAAAARTKLVAKIATDAGKAANRKTSGTPEPPNAITVVPPGQEAEFLAPLPAQALWGVGPKTAGRLAESGIHTIGEIAKWPADDLTQRFGKHGAELNHHARGIDDSPIIIEHEAKSISQETTFARDINDPERLKGTLRELSGQVGEHLRKSDLKGRTVKLKLRWSDFITITRQTTLSAPTDQDEEIYRSVLELFERVWETPRPLRRRRPAAAQMAVPRRPAGPAPQRQVPSGQGRDRRPGRPDVDRPGLHQPFRPRYRGHLHLSGPRSASVSDFAMFIGTERVKGEILDSREARRIYEDIVRRMKDPGLLEYMGRNLFRARVYPIPANGEKRVQISYTEVLKADNGLVRYLYPLNTERFSRDPLAHVRTSVRISSQVRIVNVYSPSHKVTVKKEGKGAARVGYEDRDVRPDKDFLLFYSLSKDDVGMSFLSWEGPEGGYFMFLASPRFAAPGEKVVAKNVVLVLDSSGSMSGAKIRQAKEAARFILNHLDRRDAFTLIDFDDGVTAFSNGLVPRPGATAGRRMPPC